MMIGYSSLLEKEVGSFAVGVLLPEVCGTGKQHTKVAAVVARICSAKADHKDVRRKHCLNREYPD